MGRRPLLFAQLERIDVARGAEGLEQGGVVDTEPLSTFDLLVSPQQGAFELVDGGGQLRGGARE